MRLLPLLAFNQKRRFPVSLHEASYIRPMKTE